MGWLYKTEQYVFCPQGGRHSAHIWCFLQCQSLGWVSASDQRRHHESNFECVLADRVSSCRVLVSLLHKHKRQTATKTPHAQSPPPFTPTHPHCTWAQHTVTGRTWNSRAPRSLPVRTWLLSHQRQVILVISSIIPPLNPKVTDRQTGRQCLWLCIHKDRWEWWMNLGTDWKINGRVRRRSISNSLPLPSAKCTHAAWQQEGKLGLSWNFTMLHILRDPAVVTLKSFIIYARASIMSLSALMTFINCGGGG